MLTNDSTNDPSERRHLLFSYKGICRIPSPYIQSWTEKILDILSELPLRGFRLAISSGWASLLRVRTWSSLTCACRLIVSTLKKKTSPWFSRASSCGTHAFSKLKYGVKIRSGICGYRLTHFGRYLAPTSRERDRELWSSVR